MTNKSLTGRVFDIRRFAVHDGDGIRTTIFLKGCPLRCRWCQNPEGIPMEPTLFWFKNKCIQCGICVKVCPHQALSQKDGKIIIDHSRCTLCLDCVDACPAAALAPDSSVMTVEETVEKALSDRPFFKHGGGVTLSGGEPLMQFDFALALLKALKAEGIHTAIETSLYTNPERLEAVLPYLDQIFADCKFIDHERHGQGTGVDNTLILSNIKLLLENAGNKTTIRTPLIPDFTADKENISAIARFLYDILPTVHYELLNYNPLAESKYELTEREFCYEKNPPLYSKEKMKEFADVAIAAGLTRVTYL